MYIYQHEIHILDLAQLGKDHQANFHVAGWLDGLKRTKISIHDLSFMKDCNMWLKLM